MIYNLFFNLFSVSLCTDMNVDSKPRYYCSYLSRSESWTWLSHHYNFAKYVRMHTWSVTACQNQIITLETSYKFRN